MKGLLLLSGGIDSPVAGYLMKKKLDDIQAVYFDNSPYADDTNLKRALKNAKKIGLKKFYSVPQGAFLEEFGKNADKKFLCVFCKRTMLRLSEKLAKEKKLDVLINGDNLAQVASQTLQNLNTVSSAVKIPILRPLIGFDKNEIIKIAVEIGTYDISTSPAQCCNAVPNKPATRSAIEKLEEEEKKVNIDKLIEKSMKNIKEFDL